MMKASRIGYFEMCCCIGGEEVVCSEDAPIIHESKKEIDDDLAHMKGEYLDQIERGEREEGDIPSDDFYAVAVIVHDDGTVIDASTGIDVTSDVHDQIKMRSLDVESWKRNVAKFIKEGRTQH